MLMQRIKSGFVIILISIFTFSCSDKEEICSNAPDVSDIEVNISTKDYTEELIEINYKEEALAFIENKPFLSKYFFDAANFPGDSALAKRMLTILTNSTYKDTVYQQVVETFGDFSDIKNDFTKAFQYYKHYYPEVNDPEIEIMLSGLQKDLYVSDSLISFAADYFLGPDAAFVPAGVPDYILRRYQKEYIVPMSMLLITQSKNRTNFDDKTLLADMVFFGKSYYLAKQTVPCTPDSLLIGYTEQEIEDINKNEHIIWANFLENDLLYETSHFIKNKFTGERPKTFEISNNCPGRIGIWVGWQIVKSYMKNNPEVSIQELMEQTDAQNIFKLSGYKPRS